MNGNQSDNSASASGAAYVFVRSGTTWSQQAYLKASNTGADDCFGCSVAVSGDTVVVGAYGEDSSATGVNGNQTDNSAASAGAAYVFVRSGTHLEPAGLPQGLQHRQAMTGSASSVAVSGDTVVVGRRLRGQQRHRRRTATRATTAPPMPVRPTCSCAAAATWSQQAYLKASNTESE